MHEGPSGARRLEVVATTFILLLAILGTTLWLLTLPPYTRVLASVLHVEREAGIDAAIAHESAEDVRRFVTSGDAPPLPAVVADRNGFDERAVSHLLDVRRVLRGVFAATAVGLLGAVGWMAFALRRKRLHSLARTLRATGRTLVGGTVALAVFGVLGWDRLFAGMHGVFFEGDTWLFPPDDIIVQLFPTPFWAVSGAVWAALVLGCAAVTLIAAGKIEHKEMFTSTEQRVN